MPLVRKKEGERIENNLIHAGALRIADKLNKYAGKEGIELLKMVFGIEVLLVNISKTIIIYSLSALLGILPQTLIANAAFAMIKKYSFGLHALNSTVCTITSAALFVFVPFFLNGQQISNWVVLAFFPFIILALYKYAPADTEKSPLIGRKKRDALRKKAVICGIILMAVTLLVPDGSVKTLLTLGAAFQTALILPITYKILKRSERNYEEYEQQSN